MKWTPYAIFSTTQQFLLSDSYDFILFQKFAFWILHPHHLLHLPRIPGNEYHTVTPQPWISLAYRRKNPKLLLKRLGNLLLFHSDQYHSMWDWLLNLKTCSSWRLWCLAPNRDGVCFQRGCTIIGQSTEPSLKNWKNPGCFGLRQPPGLQDTSLPPYMRNGESLQSGGTAGRTILLQSREQGRYAQLSHGKWECAHILVECSIIPSLMASLQLRASSPCPSCFWLFSKGTARPGSSPGHLEVCALSCPPSRTAGKSRIVLCCLMEASIKHLKHVTLSRLASGCQHKRL